MFPTKLLPLLALGCAPHPDTPGEVEIEPPEDQADDSYEPEDFDSMDSSEVRSKMNEHLLTLQTLEVIQVGDVILDLPDEAICAYGWSPCSGFEDEVEDALRSAGPRLDTLAHHAQVAANESAEPQTDTCNDYVIDANLGALADLEIIEVGDLLVEEPERNCAYNLPCEEDIIAAEQVTCERADTLDRIVEKTLQL